MTCSGLENGEPMIVLIVWRDMISSHDVRIYGGEGQGEDRPQGTLGVCGEGMMHDHLDWRQLQLQLIVIGFKPHDSCLAYQSYTCLSGPGIAVRL